ncbi:Aldose 1-epimerase [Variovorax sp. OV329]|nr:Aldose 1-epimerase [Variovorax sp. OV329]
MHGPGWRRPWTVIKHGDGSLAMELMHRADRDWPFEFRAEQFVRLRAGQLELELRLHALAAQPMPAGLGWHPYFPDHGDVDLQLRARRDWPVPADVMPVGSVPLPVVQRLVHLRRHAPRDALVRALSEWDGSAVLHWPSQGCALSLKASRLLRHVILFAPTDAPFLCVEPVSHAIDGFNLQARGLRNTGTRTLAPGQTLRASLRMQPLER